MTKKYFPFVFLFVVIFFTGCKNKQYSFSENSRAEKDRIAVADQILTRILTLYDVPKYGLLAETYPENPDHKVDYLAEGAVQKQHQEVSFLWPYSGVLSGTVSLYKETKNQKYLTLLEEQILPGLEKYWDTTRTPSAYQSYPVFAGHSDRFYDDNVWLALDFCSLYESTQDQKYLDKALQLYDFIFSGWDEQLGGGIYWCEQKKGSKNTCSNAPTAVLCARLSEITKNNMYLEKAKETYEWTKKNLLDPSDQVYWDNVSLSGKISEAKYTYNSGQMIEAAVRLYRITQNKAYLDDAQKTAEGTYKHFVKELQTKNGLQPFYPYSPWFNVILFRGLKLLYETDGNEKYVQTMINNAKYALENTLDENQLFGKSWYKKNDNKYKWLLDNACMIELFAESASFNKQFSLP